MVLVYECANPTFYRALFDRLLPGERLRMETHDGEFEMSREEFEGAFPRIVRSRSYQGSSNSAPGSARYVVGRAPTVIKHFRVTD